MNSLGTLVGPQMDLQSESILTQSEESIAYEQYPDRGENSVHHDGYPRTRDGEDSRDARGQA